MADTPRNWTLEVIVEDATALKNVIKGGRDSGALTMDEAGLALSAIGQLIRVLKDAANGLVISRATHEYAPLPEWMRFPNRSMPCPMCGNDEQGHVKYEASTSINPTRMRHACSCGYFIFTKPNDLTADLSP